MTPFQGIVLGIVLIVLLANAFRIMREYDRAVVFRLGQFIGVKGPGLVLLIPFIDRAVRVDLRIHTDDIPPQDVITRDNVSVMRSGELLHVDFSAVFGRQQRKKNYYAHRAY